jgi:hypothetical protein
VGVDAAVDPSHPGSYALESEERTAWFPEIEFACPALAVNDAVLERDEARELAVAGERLEALIYRPLVNSCPPQQADD